MKRKHQKNWQYVYLFQFGAIRRIRACPTRMDTMWRDEMGLEYPNHMIRTELTDPRHIALFKRCERERRLEREAVQRLIHPENYTEDT